MTDIIDRAAELEQMNRDLALQENERRSYEPPDEDANGRYCLDCSEQIPDERIIRIPWAVRCVECQQLHERREAVRVGRHR